MAAAEAEQEAASEALARMVAEQIPPLPKPRASWSTGTRKELLNRAINSFLNKNDLWKTGAGADSQNKLTKRLGIPQTIFLRALDRRRTGATAAPPGRPPSIGRKEQIAVIDAVAGSDDELAAQWRPDY